MSLSPTELVHHWFDQVWNGDNPAAILELMMPDAVAHGLGPEPIRGAEQFQQFYGVFRSAFQRVHVAVEEVIESGDVAAYRARVSATPRDGRPPYRFEGAGFVRVEGGRIAEGWNFYDFAGLLVQAGSLAPTAMQTMLEEHAAL